MSCFNVVICGMVPVFFLKSELKLLEFLCDAYTTREISEKMFLSPRTIERYRMRLLEKTGCKNAVALVIYALKEGLVDIDSVRKQPC